MSLDSNNNQNTSEHYDAYVDRHLRRNYLVNLLYGLFGTTGFRLFFAPTFVPKYVLTLSNSNTMVGLLQAVGAATHIITLFFAVRFAETSKLRNRVFGIGLTMRSQILLMALAGFFFSTRLNLIAFFVFFALFNLFNGVQMVVYSMVMSKIIPTRVRGTFVGLRNFLGGIMAWLVARQAAVIIADLPFPQSYAWTFLAAFILTTIGICFFFFSKEPATPTEYAPTPRPDKLVKEMWQLLQAERGFRNFIIVRILSSASFIGSPFYILYASHSLGLQFSDIADITAYMFLTETIFSLVWGRLADRFGFRAVFLIGLTATATAIGLLLFMPPSLNLTRLIFSLLGAGMGGFMIGSENLTLEFGSIEDRPRRITIAGIAGDIMRGMTPLLGGFIADTLGYKPVFAIGFIVILISGVVMYKLVEEPRFAKKTAG
jgi:MFS family permease